MIWNFKDKFCDPIVVETIENTTMMFFNPSLDEWPSIRHGYIQSFEF